MVLEGDRSSHHFEKRVRELVDAHDTREAANIAIRGLGAEVLGFLSGVLGNDADADEVFAAASIRLWRSLETFRWGCSLRTWAYVIARREVGRFRQGTRRHIAGRTRISDLTDVIAAVQTESRSTRRSEKVRAVSRLREELVTEDRMLLVLRIDRGLSWHEIALAFLEDPEVSTPEDQKREAARLRQRFQSVKRRLGERARSAGLLSRE